MKKFFSFILGILCLTVLFTGCAGRKDKSTTVVSNNNGCSAVLQVVKIEGHSYLVACYGSGVAVIHAESCHCKNK